MPRLSHVQAVTRQQVNRLAGSNLLPEQLGVKLLDVLQNSVPSDGQRLFGVDRGSLLFNRLLAASASDNTARRDWLRNTYLATHPLTDLTFPRLMRAGLTSVAFHPRIDTCWGAPPSLFGRLADPEHYQSYHEVGMPAGGVLHACFAANGTWIAALALYRWTPGHLFKPTDVAFLRLLAPTIALAFRAALSREQADNPGTTDPNGSGILVLGPDQRVRYSTPAGEAWSRLLRDSEREGHSPLPTAVWSAVARLRSRGDGPPFNTVLAPTSIGPVRIEASVGQEDTVAVVLSQERLPDAPEVPADWPLTQQERRVVRLLLRGLGNRQISVELAVSEKTVESHLGHVYEKLEVHSRSHLLTRYFSEVHGPTLNLVDGAGPLAGSQGPGLSHTSRAAD